jgi:hypothetical protein
MEKFSKLKSQSSQSKLFLTKLNIAPKEEKKIEIVNEEKEEKEEIQKIERDRSEEVLKALKNIDGKIQKSAIFSGNSFELNEINEDYKFNSIEFDKKNKVIIQENDNIPNDDILIFQISDVVGEKYVKAVIENFHEFPNSVVGQIQAKYENTNLVIIGTGTLIGPNVVLTTASNLYRKDLGNFLDIKFNINII